MCVLQELHGPSCMESLTHDLEEVILAIFYAKCHGHWIDVAKETPERHTAKLAYKAAWWRWVREAYPLWFRMRHS